MGKQKKANRNAQANNNAKHPENHLEEFASYAEAEVQKMHHGKKTK